MLPPSSNPPENLPEVKTVTTVPLTAMNLTGEPGSKRRKILIYAGLALLLVVILGIIGLMPVRESSTVYDFLAENISSEFFLYMLGGFIAQMVDGALGMAYGLTSTTFLLSVGISPAAASASVHASEVFTSGASGLMHLKLKMSAASCLPRCSFRASSGLLWAPIF